jgi:hypothetical protein
LAGTLHPERLVLLGPAGPQKVTRSLPAGPPESQRGPANPPCDLVAFDDQRGSGSVAICSHSLMVLPSTRPLIGPSAVPAPVRVPVTSAPVCFMTTVYVAAPAAVPPVHVPLTSAGGPANFVVAAPSQHSDQQPEERYCSSLEHHMCFHPRTSLIPFGSRSIHGAYYRSFSRSSPSPLSPFPWPPSAQSVRVYQGAILHSQSFPRRGGGLPSPTDP